DTNPELYTQEIEEVRLFGGKNNTNVTTIARSDDQTEIAIFWAYDRADTFRPYGQLNQITQEIAVREGNTLGENARLFAQLHIALADAAIVAWRAKYEEMQPRPDDVIAEGFAANDGIEATVADPDWEPLLAPTPPFPDYISGHSTFGGAWAGVLTNFFDNPNYEFDAVSQELPDIIRHYNSFYDAAFDDAISRVYGGIHVREATVTDALPTGLAIGEFIAQNLFVPVADVIG
ncbi:MAG TPA: phosphoesterase, partial [Cyanobacteria bacterium UBA11148]|nr:phosphoesterase [Cyanobacteria bacterium UBA11148]